MTHLRWLVKDGKRTLQYNDESLHPDAWHDVEDYYPAVGRAVTITRTQFYDVVAAVMKESERNSFRFMGAEYNEVTELARRLGLEDGK